jgi:hypothetical protein
MALQAKQGMTQQEVDELNAELQELREFKATQGVAIEVAKGLGRTAMFSTGGWATATVIQLYRGTIRPGTEATPVQRETMMKLSGLTPLALTKEINKFKRTRGNEAFLSGTHLYNHAMNNPGPGARLRGGLDPNKVIVHGLRGSTLKIPTADAKRLNNLSNATMDVIKSGLKKADKRAGKGKDPEKFMVGQLYVMDSTNAKDHVKGFNGIARKRPRKDAP